MSIQVCLLHSVKMKNEILYKINCQHLVSFEFELDT